MTNEKISASQLTFIIVICEVIKHFTSLPVILAPPKNQDAWLVLLLSMIYTVILFLPALFLINKFKNVKFDEMIKKILGNIGSKIFTFIICLFFIIIFIIYLFIPVLYMKNYMLVNTPPVVFLIFLLVPACYAAIKGLKTISRLSYLLFVIIVSTIMIFLILGMSRMDLTTLLPILAKSKIFELNIGAFLTGARVFDIFIIFVLYDRLEDTKKINKVFFSVLIISIFLILLILIPVQTTLGLEFARNSLNPYFMYVKQIEVYDFIQRIEAFNAVCWLISIMFKLSIYLYIASHYLSKIFKCKSNKWIAILISAIPIVILQFVPIDKTYIVRILNSNSFMVEIVLPFILGLPLILLIVYFVKRKKISLPTRANQTNIL